jgi:dihydroorotate dehydrogenase electron transfer subunit
MPDIFWKKKRQRVKKSSLERPNPGNYASHVIENARLNDRYFLLALSKPDGFPGAMPGNFLHVLVPSRERFFLRRPFSIFDCDEERITLLILEKGEGTRLMRNIPAGSKIEFIGPLGNSFPEAPGKRILAVAGGVGLAPLYFLVGTAERQGSMQNRNTDLHLLYGGREKDDLFLGAIDLARWNSEFATEDGSYGFAGNVVELAEKVIAGKGADIIFSCGPHGMLVSLAEAAARWGIPHFASLENRMACGLGLCRSCVIKVKAQGGTANRTVCHDGPVFDAKMVVWSELPLL